MMDGERGRPRIASFLPNRLPAFGWPLRMGRTGYRSMQHDEHDTIQYVLGIDQDRSENDDNDRRANMYRAVYTACDTLQGGSQVSSLAVHLIDPHTTYSSRMTNL